MKQIVGMGLVLLVLVAGGLLNPSEQHHKETIIAQYNEQNPITGTLGIGYVLAELTTYHNHVFYSTTTIGEETVSTGYVGHVSVRSLDLADLPDFILDQLPEDIKEYLGRQD